MKGVQRQETWGWAHIPRELDHRKEITNTIAKAHVSFISEGDRGIARIAITLRNRKGNSGMHAAVMSRVRAFRSTSNWAAQNQ